jgi:hypothetical protein
MIDPISTANVQILQAVKTAPVKAEKVQEQPTDSVKASAPRVQTVSKETLVKAPPMQLDMVDLSLPAQARLMQQQGLTIHQIAVRMDLDSMTISRYLGI